VRVTIVAKGNAKIAIDLIDCQSHCMHFEFKVINPSREPEFFQFCNKSRIQSPDDDFPNKIHGSQNHEKINVYN
jgi:hypothetical protein